MLLTHHIFVTVIVHNFVHHFLVHIPSALLDFLYAVYYKITHQKWQDIYSSAQKHMFIQKSDKAVTNNTVH
jgi:hypothetical protein